MIHSYSMSQWLLFFFLYSFVGWIWESCYVSAKKHRWVNRGFMHGPMLPLYGSGAVAVLVSTIGIRENAGLVFLAGMTAATLLEYVTGYAMEWLFHVKYWDYSNQKLNLKGYICVTSSLCWGVFSILLVRVVHVPIEELVLKIPTFIADCLAIALTVTAAVDLTQSFNEAMDMKRILVQLQESKTQIRKLQEKLKVASEEAAEDYRKRTLEKAERKLTRKQKYQEYIDMKREERARQLTELSARIEQLLHGELSSKADEPAAEAHREELLTMKKSIFSEIQKMGSRTDRNYLRAVRLLKRNPGAVSKKFADALDDLKEFMNHGQR